MAGARGTTLGEAATAPDCDVPLGTEGAGTELAERRTGGGGGTERKAPDPDKVARAEGGSGMRELGGPLLPLPGRGTTLTGRGATLAEGDADGSTSTEPEALGSFSSPIERGSGPRPLEPRL
ncbi:MAG: hypothetical protein K0R38_3324 [Polyangiaceae bacterium]|nr:hypothetical protein [Polyangiaceae bacterium]